MAENVHTPDTSDVRLALVESGRATMETRAGHRRERVVCRPGWLGLRVPDRPDESRYRTDEPMHSIKVDIPRRTFERTAEQLGATTVFGRLG
jgi:hypothetical protein